MRPLFGMTPKSGRAMPSSAGVLCFHGCYAADLLSGHTEKGIEEGHIAVLTGL